MERKKRTSNAREILFQRVYSGNTRRQEELAQTRRETALGQKIRRLREDAGLTQQALAAQIGTQPSAISRIEDADYDRHSVSLLARIAEALDMRLVIDFERKEGPSNPRKIKTQ